MDQRDLFGGVPEPELADRITIEEVERVRRELREEARARAKARRALGMSRVEAAAERELEGWRERALDFLVTWGRGQASFRTEDVRAAARAAGFPSPPNEKAWGPVVSRAQSRGLIVRVGTGHSDCSNRSLARLWAVVEDPPAEVD